MKTPLSFFSRTLFNESSSKPRAIATVISILIASTTIIGLAWIAKQEKGNILIDIQLPHKINIKKEGNSKSINSTNGEKIILFLSVH